MSDTKPRRGHFMYVTSEAARDFLLESGYSMILENRTKGVYVFENRDCEFRFEHSGFPILFSDTLTFA